MADGHDTDVVPRRLGALGQLDLLGGFSLRRGGEPVRVPHSTQRLLALLALVPRPHARASVTARLWPEVDDERGMGNLRSALWRLGRMGGGGLVSAGEDLRVRPELDIDVARGWALTHRVLADPGQVPGGGAAGLLHLDVLPGWDEEWVRAEREGYRQARLHALEALSDGLARGGRYGEAISAALAAVTADPLRESAQRSLIGAYLAEGNRAEALRQYRDCHRLFVERLGIPPSRRLDDLIGPALAPR